MTGAPDFAGTALVQGERILVNTSGTLAGQAAAATTTVHFTRPGYQISVQLQNTSVGGTAMPVQIDCTWEDSGTALIVGHQRWYAMAASRTNTHVIVGSGPTGGDQLVLSVFNNGSAAQTLSYTVLIVETSAAYAAHDWRTDDSGGMLIAGFTSAPSNMVAGSLAVQPATSLGAGATSTLILPVYRGRVRTYLNTASGTTDLSWGITTIAGTVNASSLFLTAGASDAAGNVKEDVWLPGAQCALILVNHNGGAQNITAALTAARLDGGYG